MSSGSTIAYGAATSQGFWRVQEDGFFADPVRGTFALADGMGGKGSGDLATKKVLREIYDQRLSAKQPPAFSSDEQLVKFNHLNQSLFHWNQARKITERGACSLALVEWNSKSKTAVVSQCGGCTVLLFRRNQLLVLLLPQVEPQTFTPPELSLGLPTGREWNPPQQLLGVQAQISIESRFFQTEKNDLLFLLSSGVRWNQPHFLQLLQTKFVERQPGTSLASVAAALVNDPGLVGDSVWNRTLIVAEVH